MEPVSCQVHFDGSSCSSRIAMYTTSPRKHKRASGAGYLARPRLGAYRGPYSSKYYLGHLAEKQKKLKSKKSVTPKMDYRKTATYTDTAYREAVSRLRVLLAESYTPVKRILKDESGEDTDNVSLLSSRSRYSHHGHYRASPLVNRRYPYYPSEFKHTPSHTNHLNVPPADPKNVPPHPSHGTQKQWEETRPNPELMSFIQRQEEYIDQLEREAQFCRGELSGLLGKVKDVISENESLHEKQKSGLIKSVFEHLETETETETEHETFRSPRKSKSPRRHILEGPSIVFESRISELEAQLVQIKIDLRKSEEENSSLRQKIADGSFSDVGFDGFKKQIEILQREKESLQESVTKLQISLSQLRDKDNDATSKIKRSLDVVEQAHFEKSQADSEIRRLKDELERQHSKLREVMNEQTRKLADERSTVERRYSQQIDQLNNELAVQWETTSKLQLELDKQRRDDNDIRRELAQKQAYIDELKKDMHSKIAAMQSDLTTSAAEKSVLEQQIASLQLANERTERQAKQESGRLQAEVQSLRQRLDRADADLLHSRRENLRLSEQVASLEKEINMNAILSEDKGKKTKTTDPVLALPSPEKKDDREKQLTSMIMDMEAKHVATVAELEGMIQSQNQLMEKLRNECYTLTQKLEDASDRHKVDRQTLRRENAELVEKLGRVWRICKNLHPALRDDCGSAAREEIRELQSNLDFLSNKFNQQSSYKEDEQHSSSASRRPPSRRSSTVSSDKPFVSNAQPLEQLVSNQYGEQSQFVPEYENNQEYQNPNEQYPNEQYNPEYSDQQYADQQYSDQQYSEEQYAADGQNYDQSYTVNQPYEYSGGEQYSTEYPAQQEENIEQSQPKDTAEQ